MRREGPALDKDIAVIRAELFTALPEAFRVSGRRSGWVDANKPGSSLHSFLEGPTFAPDGALWVVDIPYGRIFRVGPDSNWSLQAEYDGWPNGMRWHSEHGLCIADYKRGILRLDPDDGSLSPIFETNRSEGFKGCNDLWFAKDGTLFFTDQGQTGLHDPTGRVYRSGPALQHLELLIGNAPSPNGLVTDLTDRALFVAMTRACEVWRLPLFPMGTSKVQLFARLPAGTSGADGMAMDNDGNLYVCHASRGTVFVFDPIGDEIARVDCRHIGMSTTNLAFGGEGQRELFITVSDAGAIAKARLPASSQ